MKNPYEKMTPKVGYLWIKYKIFIEDALKTHTPSLNAGNLDYWRERLFINCMIYALPISMIALIPSVIITYLHGHLLIPVFDVFAMILISLVVLNKRYSLLFRKTFVVLMFYILSVVMIAVLGSFGIGSIYLLALSVFIALLFPSSFIYLSVAANVLIYAGFALIIQFRLFHLLLIDKYSTSFWIGYSLNFLFLNLVVVVQIRQVISGMANAIDKEAALLKELQAELTEKKLRNARLKESEAHYRSLFSLNPSPMWIFDKDTLRILQVNDAAISKYGYTEAEFLTMTIKDIRNEDDIDELLAILEDPIRAVTNAQCTARHRAKDGHLFYADVRCSTIPFKGQEARLVIARNITAQIEHTQAIEKQNARLREIAHMQSHVVRAPLSRIIALTDLIIQDPEEKPDINLLNYLDISVKELDGIIRTIVNNSEESLSVVQSEH